MDALSTKNISGEMKERTWRISRAERHVEFVQ